MYFPDGPNLLDGIWQLPLFGEHPTLTRAGWERKQKAAAKVADHRFGCPCWLR